MPHSLVIYYNELNECNHILGLFDYSPKGKEKRIKAVEAYCKMHDIHESNIKYVHLYNNTMSLCEGHII